MTGLQGCGTVVVVVVVCSWPPYGVGRCRRPYRASTHGDLHARPKPPSATKGRLKRLAHRALSIATLIITSCAPVCRFIVRHASWRLRLLLLLHSCCFCYSTWSLLRSTSVLGAHREPHVMWLAVSGVGGSVQSCRCWFFVAACTTFCSGLYYVAPLFRCVYCRGCLICN